MNSDASGVREFMLEDGWEFLVGKTASDNDRLSIKVGRPSDFWFHVAGMPGPHVIARHPNRPDRCPREIKRLGAGIAAFYSKAKTAKKVAVHWTSCKNVTKSRNAPQGQVQLKKYETIMAEPIDPKTRFGGNSCI